MPNKIISLDDLELNETDFSVVEKIVKNYDLDIIDSQICYYLSRNHKNYKENKVIVSGDQESFAIYTKDDIVRCVLNYGVIAPEVFEFKNLDTLDLIAGGCSTIWPANFTYYLDRKQTQVEETKSIRKKDYTSYNEFVEFVSEKTNKKFESAHLSINRRRSNESIPYKHIFTEYLKHKNIKTVIEDKLDTNQVFNIYKNLDDNILKKLFLLDSNQNLLLPKELGNLKKLELLELQNFARVSFENLQEDININQVDIHRTWQIIDLNKIKNVKKYNTTTPHSIKMNYGYADPESYWKYIFDLRNGKDMKDVKIKYKE